MRTANPPKSRPYLAIVEPMFWGCNSNGLIRRATWPRRPRCHRFWLQAGERRGIRAGAGPVQRLNGGTSWRSADAEWIAKVFLSEPQRGRPPMGLEIPASLRVWPKGHDLQQSRRRSKLGLCRHKKALSALYPIGCFECVCCLSFRLLTGRRGVGGYFAARSAFLHGSFNERRARTQFAIARCVVAPSFVI